MTDKIPINKSLNNTTRFDKVSNLHQFLYYLSFVLVYATLAFISAMYLMDYEDRYSTLNWTTEAASTEKISFVIFYILQFPLGLLFGLFTGNYYNGLFAFILNPLFMGWTFQKFVIKSNRIKIKKTFLINYAIWMVLILTMLIYIATE